MTILSRLEFRPADVAAAANIASHNVARGTAGCWRSDAGALNRLVLLEHAGRGALEDALAANGIAPLCARSHIVQPLPFAPPLLPARLGTIYELREYLFPTAAIADLIERWSEAIEGRARLAPFVGAWRRDKEGGISEIVHLWAYGDANDWQEKRRLAKEKGLWPPRSASDPEHAAIRQRSLLLIPLPGSPLS